MKHIYQIILGFILLLSIITTAQAKEINVGWEQRGITSYYHRSLNGNKTASGERYRHLGAMTAAHRSLPFGTKVQVTDRNTGKSIIVKINDRGPFVGKRVLDLSGKAAQELGIVQQGLCDVSIKVLSVPTRKDQKRKVFGDSRLDSIGELIANNFVR